MSSSLLGIRQCVAGPSTYQIRRIGTTSVRHRTPNYPGHIPLNWSQDALLAVGSGVVGVLDTTRGGWWIYYMYDSVLPADLRDIDLVASLSESTASTFLPSLHGAMVSTAEGRQIMRDKPTISSESMAGLRRLRRGTVGREWVEWCDRGNVTPDTRSPVCDSLTWRLWRDLS
jgi:ubiquinone biosynthesis protein COQ4